MTEEFWQYERKRYEMIPFYSDPFWRQSYDDVYRIKTDDHPK